MHDCVYVCKHACRSWNRAGELSLKGDHSRHFLLLQAALSSTEASIGRAACRP